MSVPLLICALCGHVTAAPPPASAEGLSFGVFPFLEQSRLEKTFAPLTSGISSAIGEPVRYRSARSMRKFTKRLKRGKYDIVFVQPFDYVRYGARAGYLPTVGGGGLTAVVVTRSDDPAQQLGDLKGERVVALPPIAAVTHLLQAALIDIDLVPGKDVDLEYLNSHDSCLQFVQSGRARACVSADSPLRIFGEKYGAKMKTIFRSVPIMRPSVMVHKRVPAVTREKIAAYLAEHEGSFYHANNAGATVERISDADYDLVRLTWDKVREAMSEYR